MKIITLLSPLVKIIEKNAKAPQSTSLQPITTAVSAPFCDLLAAFDHHVGTGATANLADAVRRDVG